jgi:hypothetical protein
VQSRRALASAVIDPVTAMPAQSIGGATVCPPLGRRAKTGTKSSPRRFEESAPAEASAALQTVTFSEDRGFR